MTLRFHANQSYNWYLTKAIPSSGEISLDLSSCNITKDEAKIKYGIGKYVFAGTSIKELILSKSITSILGYAFADSNIEKVVIRSEKPPLITSDSFKGINKKITIQVPVGSIASYSSVLWTNLSQLTLPDKSQAVVIEESSNANPVIENIVPPLYYFGKGTTEDTIQISSNITEIGRMALWGTIPTKLQVVDGNIVNENIDIDENRLIDNNVLIKSWTTQSISGGNIEE